MTPLTCGVAKFNAELARRLGIPFCRDMPESHALVSLKPSEGPPTAWSVAAGTYDLLLHDWIDASFWRGLARDAVRLFAASPPLACDVEAAVNRSVVGLWCPTTIAGNPDRGSLRILTFGMASRLDVAPRLAALLHRVPDATVELSCGIHEGRPWDATWQHTVEAYGRVFGERLRVLGFLADDGLARALDEVDAVVLPYRPAARANNTTLWAALAAGAPVITTLDPDSPPDLVHDQTVFDLNRLDRFPGFRQRGAVGQQGRVIAEARGWDAWLAAIQHGLRTGTT